MIALLRAVAGLIFWAIAFSSLYALQGLACALGWDSVEFAGVSAARAALVLLYAGWISALLWLCWYLYPQNSHRDFLSQLAFACAIIGLVSTIYTGVPVVATTVCSYAGEAPLAARTAMLRAADCTYSNRVWEWASEVPKPRGLA